MPTYKKRPDFLSSQEGISASEMLTAMSQDDAYNTIASYSANTVLYPNNSIPFVDKHLHYLRDHPGVDTKQYLSNLRLMTRIK